VLLGHAVGFLAVDSLIAGLQRDAATGYQRLSLLLDAVRVGILKQRDATEALVSAGFT
jgi:hypothetical protein